MISAGNSLRQLFPLPLTAFEQYMLADDRPRYPMGFFIEIVVSGQLRQAEFETAVNLAFARHPLLNACIQSTWRGKQWVPSARTSAIAWNDGEPKLPAVTQRYMDLRREPGVRVCVGYRPEASRIVFQFHHAATDGIGAIQFIGDVLAFYGMATCSRSHAAPEVVPVDLMCLRLRGQRLDPGWKHAGSIAESLGRIAEIVGVHPSALFAPADSPTIDVDSIDPNPFVTRIIERHELLQLKQAASRQGVTPNELYTLAMFRTLHDWNARYGGSCDTRPMRIGLPASLRTPAHDASPAANILSMMFVTRKGRAVHDSDALLRFIHRDINRITSAGDHAVFALIMEWTRRIPGGLKLLTRMPRRTATALLANVGEVKRQLRNRFPIVSRKCVAGNIILEHLLGAAPIRPGTRLGTSLGTYAGRMFINFNVDPYLLTREQAQELADGYISQLNAIGDLRSPASSGNEIELSKSRHTAKVPT